MIRVEANLISGECWLQEHVFYSIQGPTRLQLWLGSHNTCPDPRAHADGDTSAAARLIGVGVLRDVLRDALCQ